MNKALTVSLAVVVSIVVCYVAYNAGYSVGFSNGYLKGEYFLTGKVGAVEYGLRSKLDEIEYELTKGNHVGDKEWAKVEFGKWVSLQKEKNAKYFSEFTQRYSGK